MARARKILTLAALVTSVATATMACGGQDDAGPRASRGAGRRGGARAGAPRPVDVVHPEPSPHPRVLTVHGTLEARETVDVAARVEGPVTAVSVDLGDRVRKNQPLARIAAGDFAAHNTQLDAELSQARADLARLERLATSQMATAQQLDQARTRVSVAQAQRSVSGRQLRDTSVRAPFDGAIAQRLVSPGAFVHVGAPLFKLVSTDDLKLALEVPEQFASAVRAGSLVTISSEGDRTLDARAEVVRIAPTVDPQTRSFRIEARVPNDSGLRAGMFVVGSIELGRADAAVRLPRTAVFNVLGHDRVVLVRGDRAQPRDVELLAEESGDAIVLGVAPSDSVVVRGGATLAPGAAVRVVPAASPSAGGPRAIGDPG